MTGQSATMKKIKLEPARAKGPQDVNRDAYEFIAPLDETAHIHLDTWKANRNRCFVHRLHNGVTVERGLLVHRPGGAGGATWAFDYEEGQGDEEAGYRFGAHAFTPGEYVSIRDEDGELQTFRVASVAPA